MGHDEMSNVRDLDVALLDKHKDRIWFYYAEKDDWVGDQREAVLHAINADPGYVRVVRGHRDIPHAFCISMCIATLSYVGLNFCFLPSDHGEQVAEQCYQWLVSGGFI